MPSSISQGGRRDGLDNQPFKPESTASRRRKACRGHDGTRSHRNLPAGSADLLDSLETVLLDLGQDAQDRDLIDAAFRALHTIKGSGRDVRLRQGRGFHP